PNSLHITKTARALTLGSGIIIDRHELSGSEIHSGRATNGEVFTDRARELGLDFAHFNGMSGEHYYPEMIGSGAALFDYDNDGDLDIFIVQRAMLGPGKTLADAMFA